MSAHKPDLFTESELRKMYLEDDLTIQEIRSIKGCTKNTVRKWMKKFGIQAKCRIDIPKDLTGLKFNKLTVIEKHSKRKHKTYWLCQCECDKKTLKIIDSDCLRRGRIRSCGCLKYKGYEKISGYFFSSLVCRARNKKIEFDLDKKYLWDLYISQDKKCALTGLDINMHNHWADKNKKEQNTASLDRIDSSKGYTKDNVQWVHKTVNYMKLDFSQSEFKEMCKLVVNYENKSISPN